MSFWIHPALILLSAPRCCRWCPRACKKGYLLLVPVLALRAHPDAWPRATFGEVQFLDWTLVFGRVDALSLVFGYIMGLMCILGTLYGLHVKDDAPAHRRLGLRRPARSAHLRRRLPHAVPVLGTDGVLVGVPDLVPRPAGIAGARATATCWCTWRAAWRCWPASCCTARRTGRAARSTPFDVQHPTPATYLMMIGFILNAAVPPLHAWLPDAYGEATFNGSVFLCAFTTKTAVYALCRGFAGHGNPRPAGRDHGALRRRLCRARERLPPPARLPHHQPGRLHGGRRRPGHRRWPSTAPAPTPSPTSSTRACSSWAAARCCT